MKLSILTATYNRGSFLERLYNSIVQNLNSGLENFVWYYENNTPIERIKFNENLHLYDNHEIASHTVNHPCLTNLSEDELIHQVKDDVISLENTFGREITSFAVPFTACSEREIEIIKSNTPIKQMRLSEFADKNDFTVPGDNYHFKCNAYYNNADIYDHIKRFSENTLDKSIFIIVGHSYEFEVKNDWKKIEDLLKKESATCDSVKGYFEDFVETYNDKKSMLDKILAKHSELKELYDEIYGQGKALTTIENGIQTISEIGVFLEALEDGTIFDMIEDMKKIKTLFLEIIQKSGMEEEINWLNGLNSPSIDETSFKPDFLLKLIKDKLITLSFERQF